MRNRRRTPLMLLAAAPLLFPGGLAAQNTFGVGLTLVSATFTGDGTDVLERRTSIGVNAWYTLPLGDRLDFMPGLAFAPKGYSLADAGEDVTLKLSYVEIPLLVSLPITRDGGSTSFHLFGGPVLGIEAGCTIDVEAGGFSESEDCGDDESRKKFDIGVMAGAGVAIPVSERLELLVNVGVDLGLVDIDEDEGDSIKNQAFFVSAGVALPVGG